MDAEMRKFLDGVVGVVEASSYEMHMLWVENDRSQPERKMHWVDNSAGLGQNFGSVGKMPVYGSLWTRVIDGHKILFVEMTSTVIDHRMVEAWLKENLPVTAFEDCDPRQRMNQSDPMNFHNVFSEPRRRAKLAANPESRS